MFGSEARKYWEAGLSPLPIVKQNKKPVILDWSKYCKNPATEPVLDRWIDEFQGMNIGLALGKVNEKLGLQFAAVDIDDGELVEDVVSAIGNFRSGKRGAKGLTVFVYADPEIRNAKLKRRGTDGRPMARPSVEILCDGCQTVIPPSVHPDTRQPYEWVGVPLLTLRGADLPVFTKSTLDEITAHCHGKGEPFYDLNRMTWLGEGKGGDTHDTCVRAVATMVARGWDDQDILSRIDRAKREAVERAGEEYDWPEAPRVIQEWIDSARSKGMTNTAGGTRAKRIPPERMMADFAIEYLGGIDRVAARNGLIRAYKDGYWPVVDAQMLKREMYKVEPALRVHDASNALSIIMTITDDPMFGTTPGVPPKLDPRRQKLALQNGTLDLRSGELHPHNPDDQCIHKLDFSWVPGAQCPTYEKVVNQTFAGCKTSIQLWNEFCGLTLVDDMSFQKLLFLKGPGGNGKGTLARILKSVHDPNVIGSVAITDLENERKRTSLVGKLVNISGEQSRLNLISDAYLKKITGEDPIDVRRLYAETENNVFLSVRFLELVNEMPMTSDTGPALQRRMMILNCPNKVTNPDSFMDQKLHAERPGILLVWAEALRRLYERGRFEEPESSKLEVIQYLTENDPVRYWLETQTRPLEEKDRPMPTVELYAEYREWCDRMGYRTPLPEVIWGRKLTSLGVGSEVVRLPGRGPTRIRPIRVLTNADY